MIYQNIKFYVNWLVSSLDTILSKKSGILLLQLFNIFKKLRFLQ
jgi:hypothetical protein